MSTQTFSDFQQKKILHKFHLLDLDKNGVIEYDDFKRSVEVLAKARQWAPESPEYQRLSSTNKNLWTALSTYADADKDGSITSEEWLDYHAKALLGGEQKVPGFETTLAAFTSYVHDLLDADGDGFVIEEDYLEFSRASGTDDVEAIRIFDLIDQDRNGTLTLEEVSVLVRDFYLSDDPEAVGNRFFGMFSLS